MMSCWSGVDSLRKRAMTLLASLPGLWWSSIASTRLLVRPSWRKKTRCPTPQSGEVRNSSGACATLRDAVRQTPAHAVDEEVGPSSTSGMQQVVGRIPGYCFDLYVVCSS